MDRNHDDDDDKPNPREGLIYEFECPECNAHNPYPDGFRVGSEVQCFYCGSNFLVGQQGSRLKFKEA